MTRSRKLWPYVYQLPIFVNTSTFQLLYQENINKQKIEPLECNNQVRFPLFIHINSVLYGLRLWRWNIYNPCLLFSSRTECICLWWWVVCKIFSHNLGFQLLKIIKISKISKISKWCYLMSLTFCLTGESTWPIL